MIGPQIPLLLGGGYFSPYDLPGLAAAYDLADLNSVKFDASNRVSFLADKSGNSGVMGLVLNGVSGNYASTPDSAAVSITGDIDIRVNCALVDWTPVTTNTIFTKYLTAGNQISWFLNVKTTGVLTFGWSPDGSTIIQKDSTVAPTVSDFSRLWIRATLDVDNGAAGNDVIFYTSVDGVIWTKLGNTVTTAGVTSIFDSTAIVQVSSYDIAGGAQHLNGIVYRAQIYNGIAGTLAFDANFTAQARGATSFAESSSNAATVTVNTSGATGARIGGARDLYQGTGSAQPLLLPWRGANYAAFFGSLGGNNLTTPSNANINIGAGPIDIRAHVNALSSIAATSEIIYNNAGAGTGFNFAFNAAGVLRAGTSSWGVNSSAHGLTTGDFWVRVTSNASGGTVSFFKSSDGITWTALGTGIDAGRAASGNTVYIGSQSDGTAPANFQLLYLDVRNTIANDGTGIVGKIDPAQAAHNATSWTSSTGEVWTVNQSGAKPAQIVGRTSLLFDGSAYYMKSAAFTLNQPTTIILVGKQIAWTSGRYIFDGNTLNVMSARQVTSTPGFKLNAGADLGLNSDWILGQNAVVESVFNAATSLARVNRLTAVTGSAGSGNAGGLTVGDRGDSAGVFSNFQLAKMFIFSSALDTATLDKIAVWAGKQEGIAV